MRLCAVKKNSDSCFKARKIPLNSGILNLDIRFWWNRLWIKDLLEGFMA
jgi:hypothetical protein